MMTTIDEAAISAVAPTLANPGFEQQYREDGFAVMPFLDPGEAAGIEAMYWDLAPEGDNGLTVDYLRPDRSYMARISEMLAPVWDRHFPSVFTDHRAIFVTFVVKHPGLTSDMFLHEDRSWVDERRLRSGTLWIPLVDVGPGNPNGGLEIVRHSHRLATCWSGTGTPDLIRPWEACLRAALEPVTVPAGSAVYYDSRTLHASPANLTDSPRVALACGVAPWDAQLIHVVATGRRHRRIHAVDEDFFIRFGPGEVMSSGMPDRYPIIEEHDEDPLLTAEQIVALPNVGSTDLATTVVVPNDVDALLPGQRTSGPPSPPVRQLPMVLDRDLPMASSDLQPLPTAVGGLRLTAVTGTCGLESVDPTDGHPGIPERLWASIHARAGFRPRHLVVLDPRARMQIDAWPADSTGIEGAEIDVAEIEVAVIEAPALGAGMAGTGMRTNFDPGRCFDLDRGVRHVVWNDGPGPTILLFSEHAPSDPPAGRDRGVLRRLIRAAQR